MNAAVVGGIALFGVALTTLGGVLLQLGRAGRTAAAERQHDAEQRRLDRVATRQGLLTERRLLAAADFSDKLEQVDKAVGAVLSHRKDSSFAADRPDAKVFDCTEGVATAYAVLQLLVEPAEENSSMIHAHLAAMFCSLEASTLSSARSERDDAEKSGDPEKIQEARAAVDKAHEDLEKARANLSKRRAEFIAAARAALEEVRESVSIR